MGTGNGLEGASGAITFMSNGDVPATGFCVGEFSHDATTDTVSYDCARRLGPSQRNRLIGNVKQCGGLVPRHTC